MSNQSRSTDTSKPDTPEIKNQFRQDAAKLLVHFRLACGLKKQQQVLDLLTNPTRVDERVRNNYLRIEEGDPKLALSVYREAIDRLLEICSKIAPPEVMGEYRPKLLKARYNLTI